MERYREEEAELRDVGSAVNILRWGPAVLLVEALLKEATAVFPSSGGGDGVRLATGALRGKEEWRTRFVKPTLSRLL
jgi:hypothetical protein